MLEQIFVFRGEEGFGPSNEPSLVGTIFGEYLSCRI